MIKNTFWVAIADFSGKLVRTGLVIYVARYLGPHNYGRFTFVLAFTSVFVSFLDLGLSTIIVREFSKDRCHENHLPALVGLKIALAVATCALIIALSFLATPDQELRVVIWLMAVFSALSQFPEIMFAFSRARQRMGFEAAATFGQVLLIAVFVFFSLKIMPTVIGLGIAYCSAAFISLGVITVAFNGLFRSFEVRIDTGIWKQYLLEAWPLALISLFSMLYSYMDSIILGVMGLINQTGWYNAALKIIYVMSAPASFVAAAFYPVFSKYSRSNRALQKLWEMQATVILFIAVPVVLTVYTFAPEIIALLYGKDFAPAVPALRILTVMVGMIFLTTPFSNLLIALRMQKKMFWITIAGCVVNLALNLLLIPKYGFYGSAAASVFTYFAILFIYWVMIMMGTRLNLLSRRVLVSSLSTLLAGCIFEGALLFPMFEKSQIFLRFLAGITVYVVFLAVLFNPIQTLFSITQKRKR